MAIYSTHNLLHFLEPEMISSRTLAADEVIFHQGQEVQFIYFIEKGEVRAETYLPDGKRVTFFRLLEGAALGEDSIHHTHYPYTCSAAVSSKLSVIPVVEIKRLTRSNPEFAEAVLKCLTKRYVDSLALREIIATTSAEARVHSYLQWQTLRNKKFLQLEHRTGHLASELNLTPESIYRSLNKLEEKNLIHREGGNISLIQPTTE